MSTAQLKPVTRHRGAGGGARATRPHGRARLVCRGLTVAALWMLTALVAHAAVPTDVILVLDDSGSMRKNDPQFLAKNAVSSFVSRLENDTRVGIVIFDEAVNYAVPLTTLDVKARAAIQESLEALDYRGQLTDSPAAIERAIYELKTNARDGVEKIIVFMTDGIVDTGNSDVDTEKTKWMREELAADAADSGIRVFAVAFTENADFFLIQSLAKQTDGAYFRALEPEDLAGVFERIEEKLAAPPPAPVPAPPPVAAPVPRPVPAPAPPPSVASPAAQACLATLVPDERAAFEEMALEAGIPAEQLCNEMMAAPEGTAVVVRPEDAAAGEDDELGLMVVVAAGAVVLALLVLVVVLLLRRRGSAPPGVAPAGTEAIPDAFIKDIHGISDDPAVKLGAKPTLIGRVPGSDPEHLDYFVVNKGTIGRRHAMIKYRDFSFWLIDQGSVNGTFLNGERIDGERQLKHGDRIKFHKYEFEFSMPEMEDAGHTVFADPADLDATMVGEAVPAADRGQAVVDLTGGAAVAAVAHADDDGDTALSARSRAADTGDDDFGEMETGIRSAPGDDDFGEMETGIRSAPGDDDFGETETGIRPAPGGSDDFGEMETGIRPAPGGSDDFGEMETGIRPAPSGSDDDADLELVTILPDAEGTVPPVGPEESMDAEAAADEFDAEASAFFDESFGPPSIDDDVPAEPPPSPSARDGDEDFSESETLLPASMSGEDKLEGTSDISLDQFMDTEAFQATPGVTDDDATLMPADVAEPPAIDDVFDITAEGEIVAEQPDAPADGGEDDDDQDDDGESPTRFTS